MKSCAGFLPWLLKDLRELSSILNWAFMCLFCWVIVYGVTKHPELCLSTAINATASLAGWCLANYTVKGHLDRRLDMNIGVGNTPSTQVVNNVPGAPREPGMDG